jgi:hypothetical protein
MDEMSEMLAKAVDAALAAHVDKLFQVLVAGMVAGTGEAIDDFAVAVERFRAGIVIAERAHAEANLAIENRRKPAVGRR